MTPHIILSAALIATASGIAFYAIVGSIAPNLSRILSALAGDVFHTETRL